jgi:hypothetical protein
MSDSSRVPIDYKEWGDFLREVDRRLPNPIALHCLGGFVLRVIYDIPRHTGDLDYLDTVPSAAKSQLSEIAGPESHLARRYGLHIHFAGVIDMPENYASRLIDITHNLKKLSLLVPEVYDLLLSKLTRNSPKDREDIKYLIQRERLAFDKLRFRFDTEMRPATGSRERHELTIELWQDFFTD